jgi:alpha-D-xyloside xylohydrolase
VWSYGEQAYEIMTRFMLIREQIKPYLLEQMKRASMDGTPVMRPLIYDFDEDLLVNIADEYMFGPDLLVAPVVELHATSREVYLPKGVNWRDVNRGTIYEGGNTIQVETPIEKMPLFIKEGSSLKIRI